ncbi:MAG: hypothetical protein HC855_07125 [Rhizobiales bacterium]|nr:hypothetical protein [Hyphomicrobiales bacterium]
MSGKQGAPALEQRVALAERRLRALLLSLHQAEREVRNRLVVVLQNEIGMAPIVIGPEIGRGFRRRIVDDRRARLKRHLRILRLAIGDFFLGGFLGVGWNRHGHEEDGG